MNLQKSDVNETNNTIKNKLKEIINKHGPFTAQNMQLANGIYTIDENVNYDHFKLNRIKQILHDFNDINNNSTLLDIASLESMFAIEFALEGLEVTSIEGRESNLAKGKFIADQLNLKNISFFQDDVINIRPESYGQFDIILCLGILYHMKKEKYLNFLKNITECCEDILIIDTFISLRGGDYINTDGRKYNGTIWREFEESSSPKEKENNHHATLRDNLSYSMTKASLIDYLGELGYSSVSEVHLPSQPKNPIDRITLMCKKSTKVTLNIFPKFDHEQFFKLFVDTRGIGDNKTVHWNENIGKKYLRRIYRFTRHALKNLFHKFSGAPLDNIKQNND